MAAAERLGLTDALEDLHRGTLIRVCGVWGPARGLVLSAIGEASGRPLGVMTRNLAEAELVAGDLGQYLAPGQAAVFPPLEGRRAGGLVASLDVRSERITALSRLLHRDLPVVVIPVQALFDPLIPADALISATMHLYPQRIVGMERVVAALEAGGYQPVSQVEGPGTYSRRGGIVDIWPPQRANPVRLEFFGDAIESLREFDSETQRSLRAIPQVTVLPTSEVLLGEGERQMALARLRERGWDPADAPPPLATAIRTGRHAPGLEAHLPLFYGAVSTIARYLSPETVIVWDDPGAIEISAAEIERAPPSKDPLTPVPPLWKAVRDTLASFPQVHLEPFAPPRREPEAGTIVIEVHGVPRYGGRISQLTADLETWTRERRAVVLVARTESQGRRLAEILEEHDFGVAWGKDPPPGSIRVTAGELSGGFTLPALGLITLTEREIFGHRRLPPRRRRLAGGRSLVAFTDLRPGDFVVHVDHGIARFRGLEKVSLNIGEGDYLHLEYAGGDRLYVPVDKLHLVQRYAVTEGATPPLDRLGGGSWARTKERVRASIREMAKELLELYAARQVIETQPCGADLPWQREFEAAFPFEETPDQLRAIAEVKADMERPRPMDRLVCGDVGYGKTEVAMRAAFKAVMDGRQVAVLVPTTVLALQHFQSFTERAAAFPIRVEMLSRFRPRKEQQEILRGLREGTVDIVIGTHRLLQKDVRFRNLGLLVVDEEQRFGVAAKERFKQIRREVDVLTLTATPIPRTLYLAMMGARDISTIETPPEDRLAIRTYVTRFDPEMIREAVEEEVGRGGQIFFVHNRIESIHSMARFLKRLLPEVRIAVAHGQMAEHALEQIMCDFYARKYDLLLSTAIIESGLDVPTANTIIINRADRFGLAQLYQLRGRVGRDRYRAHAYLLIPQEAALSEAARKRLQVVAELTELGSGFKIAARDLEIRGAGNLLGPEQHGHIAAIGFDLYCQLIRETLEELKGRVGPRPVETLVRLPGEACIPDTYVSDPAVRLELYKRLTSVRGREEVSEMAAELADRFGPIPVSVHRLLMALELRGLATALRVEEVDLRQGLVRIRFGPEPPVEPDRVTTLLKELKGRLRYVPESTLEVLAGGCDLEGRLQAARAVLEGLR